MAQTNPRVQSKSAATPPASISGAAIPDRLYYRIGEVARLCGVAPSVLRFWESQFPQLKPTKGGTGQRLYRRRELDLALHIHQLVHLQGYTLAGARQALAQPVPAQSAAMSAAAMPAPSVPAPAPTPVAEPALPASPQALAALRAALTELREMLTRSAVIPTNSHPAAVPEAAPRRRPRLAPLAPSLFAEHGDEPQRDLDVPAFLRRLRF